MVGQAKGLSKPVDVQGAMSCTPHMQASLVLNRADGARRPGHQAEPSTRRRVVVRARGECIPFVDSASFALTHTPAMTGGGGEPYTRSSGHNRFRMGFLGFLRLGWVEAKAGRTTQFCAPISDARLKRHRMLEPLAATMRLVRAIRAQAPARRASTWELGLDGNFAGGRSATSDWHPMPPLRSAR